MASQFCFELCPKVPSTALRRARELAVFDETCGTHIAPQTAPLYKSEHSDTHDLRRLSACNNSTATGEDGVNTVRVYRDYDQEALDLQYNNRAAAPGFADHIQRYRTLTDEAKLKLKCIENLAYGTAPEETLDLYRALQDSAPVLIFVHGGAWQHLGKDDSGFAANAFVPVGAMVASLNFGHAPDATLDTMVNQVRRAVAWLWHNVMSYGGDPQKLFIAGHSSGAHLVSQCLTANWQGEYECPNDVIKGALFASGLGDLEPVRLSYRNALLKLDAQAVKRLSLVHQQPTVKCPLIVAYASSDTAEFRRQTREVGEYWRRHGLATEFIEVADSCHYDVVLDLAEPKSELFLSCARQMALCLS